MSYYLNHAEPHTSMGEHGDQFGEQDKDADPPQGTQNEVPPLISENGKTKSIIDRGQPSSYPSLSAWEMAVAQFISEKDLPAFVDTISNSMETYYRYFPALHPRHPFDCYGNDGRPIITSVTLLENGIHHRPHPNVKITIDVLNMGTVNPQSDELQVKLRLRALWKPALPETRLQVADKALEYKPLPLNELECVQAVLQARYPHYHNYSRPVKGYNAPRDLLNGASARQEDYYSAPHGENVFLGPLITMRSTCGERHEPSFAETDISGPFSFGSIGRIRARPNTQLRSSASGDLDAHVELEAECDGEASLPCKGGRRGFPFETRVVTLHINSVAGLQDIAFQEPDDADRKLWKQALQRLESRSHQWRVIGIEMISGYRTLNGEEHSHLVAHSRRELDVIRSKIMLKITFGQNRSYWYMKIAFPLDVITIMGFGAFLFIPSLESPSQDQQIATLTYLAGILIALSAFANSVQPILPVQVVYTTAFDVHSNFCFATIAILTIVVAWIPVNHWAKFQNLEYVKGIQRRGILFAVLITGFLLEHGLLYYLASHVWTSTSQPEHTSDSYPPQTPSFSLPSGIVIPRKGSDLEERFGCQDTQSQSQSSTKSSIRPEDSQRLPTRIDLSRSPRRLNSSYMERRPSPNPQFRLPRQRRTFPHDFSSTSKSRDIYYEEPYSVAQYPVRKRSRSRSPQRRSRSCSSPTGQCGKEPVVVVIADASNRSQSPYRYPVSTHIGDGNVWAIDSVPMLADQEVSHQPRTQSQFGPSTVSPIHPLSQHSYEGDAFFPTYSPTRGRSWSRNLYPPYPPSPNPQVSGILPINPLPSAFDHYNNFVTSDPKEGKSGTLKRVFGGR